jgi:hypothetical protein
VINSRYAEASFDRSQIVFRRLKMPLRVAQNSQRSGMLSLSKHAQLTCLAREAEARIVCDQALL